MNVLLVCPYHPDLPLLQSEAEALVNILKPRRVLIDDVTEGRLRSTIEDDVNGPEGPYQGIWLATHSSERAVQLSDGDLSRDALVTYVAMSGAEWIVLNGCESEGLAAGLAGIGVDVLAVAMTEDGRGIGDRDAWRLSMPLARAILECDGDLEGAVASIPSATRLHRFFPAAASAARAYTTDRDLGMSLARLEEKVDNLSRQVGEMADALDKRPTKEIMLGVMFVWAIAVLLMAGVFYQLTVRGYLI
jgi:hypothetical protein